MSSLRVLELVWKVLSANTKIPSQNGTIQRFFGQGCAGAQASMC